MKLFEKCASYYLRSTNGKLMTLTLKVQAIIIEVALGMQ
jgi:hypothetical protein